ncbi:MAG: CRISPR-associated helicase Cas3' [Gammaproteobacteria bacterium]|nr:CRISPR-associated helicase Cas3' [Gammaproteobacteria bacterium]
MEHQSYHALYWQYWGKAKPTDDAADLYHLLPYHCLDVAAVGYEYLLQNVELSDFFCNILNCSKQELLRWASFWLALHDVGKYSEAFQSQKSELFKTLQGCDPNPDKPYTERHDSLGLWLWRDWLSKQAEQYNWFGAQTREKMTGLNCWMRAVSGHHGQPPKNFQPSSSVSDFYSQKDKKAVLEFVNDIRPLLLEEDSARIVDLHDAENFEHISQALSWWFAGIAVLTDWLGSNTNYFSYKTKIVSLSDYWKYALECAKIAVNATGVIPQEISKYLRFSDVFPKIKTPSPLQEWVLSLNISKGPQIYLLEDVTGAGKTEAAIMLAYRLMATENAQGFFVALPTMATANAMYDRIAGIYKRLFLGNANLILAHGSRDLVEKFAKTVIPEGTEELDFEQRDETASACCTAWLADHNKRALLAQVGVGTIDQGLLSVLHSKHQSLRLLGLFNKVLIIDEVHACDSYMQGVLEILLEFHARSGGSVILLSATLPIQMKQSLLNAYMQGRGVECKKLEEIAYPLATYWQSGLGEMVYEHPLATRESVSRTVTVNYQHDQRIVVAEIQSALAAGKCVCWVRNTVADALSGYHLFSKLISEENITLFHARFVLHDRLEKEYKIIEQFGAESTASKRSGKLVIATQVIEQSLDLDFDFMVSDLAPIDCLIQRAGRLHRHVRDKEGNRLLSTDLVDRRGEYSLLVFGPKWSVNPSKDWFKLNFPKSSFVYNDQSILWLTAKALQCGSFTLPIDARNLIEGVFGDNSQIPLALQHNSLTVQGQQMANASLAKVNTLKFVSGYVRGDVNDWWSEAITPSRLGEPSIEVVIARWQNDRLIPWIVRAHAWDFSTVRVSERRIAKGQEPTEIHRLEEYRHVQTQLPGKGKWSVLLALEQQENGMWIGKAWSLEVEGKLPQLQTWAYDADYGLRLLHKS